MCRLLDVYKRQLEDMGMTYQAVLANDIRKRNHLSDLKITYVYHDQTYNLDNDKMCIRDRLSIVTMPVMVGMYEMFV